MTISNPLDADTSDPIRLGWMVGSPPPEDKLIRFSDESFFRFPQTRWSFSHFRELLPTAVVPRGGGPVVELPRAPGSTARQRIKVRERASRSSPPA